MEAEKRENTSFNYSGLKVKYEHFERVHAHHSIHSVNSLLKMQTSRLRKSIAVNPILRMHLVRMQLVKVIGRK